MNHLFLFCRRTLLASTLLIAGAPLSALAQGDPFCGGGGAGITKYPWTVSVEKNDGTHRQNGAIISPRWILTTRALIDPVYGYGDPGMPGDMTVHAGATDQADNSLGQRIEVDSFIWITPLWNPTDWDNDLVLLRLESPLDFNETVQPIPVATNCNFFPGCSRATAS